MSGFGSIAEKVYVRLPMSPNRATYRRLESFGGTRMRSMRLPMILAAFSLSVLFFVCLSNDSSTPTWDSPTGIIHLLVPVSKPDPNFCKVVVSGAILGYPTPQAINWGATFNDTNLVSGGSHLAKIDGVLSYLSQLKPSQDDDLVIMIDGYDTWFQLRPQTMLDRYFSINRRANARLEKELGSKTVAKYNIKQDIVFSSQKRCWPGEDTDPNCYAIPESTLPLDAFGNGTDTDIGNKQNPYIKYRPRYLNSGVAMGTAKAMRALFTESLVRVKRDPSFGSDQRIFSKIFGHQEIWREVLRRKELSHFARLRVLFTGVDVIGDKFRTADVEEAKWRGVPMEFGVGLDYESSVSLPTVFSEDDTAWVVANDAPQVQAVDERIGVPKGNSRLRFPNDIADTLSPFAVSRDGNLEKLGWKDVSIFTDVWTGFAPVVIHHNAHVNDAKKLRETWWDRIWFQKHARRMMDEYMKVPMGGVLAVAGGREWRAADEFKGGVRDDGGRWLPYEEICEGTEDEVFRDGGGPWIAGGHGGSLSA